MAHKFDVTGFKNLANKRRVDLLAPDETLLRLGLKSGGIMADVGCGTGLFSFSAAKIAGPESKIYAIDTSQEMLDQIIFRAKSENVKNIKTVKSKEYSMPVESGSVDFVFMCAVLHEVDDKQRLLSEAARLCRRGGTVAVVEFKKAETLFGPPVSARLSADYVKGLLESAGLEDISLLDISSAFYAATAKTCG